MFTIEAKTDLDESWSIKDNHHSCVLPSTAAFDKICHCVTKSYEFLFLTVCMQYGLKNTTSKVRIVTILNFYVLLP